MTNNEILFKRACQHIPGGVNSPVRAFGSVGGIPRFFNCGQGAYVWDADGDKYIDYVGSWGPLILGHAHPQVIEAVEKAARQGLSFGAPTESEIDLADLLCEMLPSLDQVRLVSSGTEATMSAIRLARGFTGRNKLIKFEGCYHGHADSLLVKAGSGLLTFGNPSSAGVPEAVANDTIVLPYNDVNALETLFASNGSEIAAVIVEPIAGNMNLVPASTEFIQSLRKVTQNYGAVLIYDEVMTGFRADLSCAQGLHHIKPDLTTLGKVIGGGMPLAAFGGRSDIMAMLAPLGPVYQAGTLSGNPISVAAGLVTLNLIRKSGFFEELTRKTNKLIAGINQISSELELDLSAQNVGGMFGIYFTKNVPKNYQDVLNFDLKSFNKFFHDCLEKGIYLAPSAFEAGFVSASHTDRDIDYTLEKIKSIFS